MIQIGEKIFQLRRKEGISQEELADKMNVSRQSVSLWETNQTLPSIDNLIAISEIFNVSLNELCGKKEEPYPEKIVVAAPGKQCLAKTETYYDKDIYAKMYKVGFSNFLVRTILGVVVSLIMGLIFAFTEGFESASLVLFSISLSIVITIPLTKRRISKQIRETMKLEPDKTVTLFFHEDFVEIEGKSSSSSFGYGVKYTDIELVVWKKDYVHFTYNNRFFGFNTPADDELGIIKLKLSAAKKFSSAKEKISNENLVRVVKQKGAFKTALLVLFVLSFFTLFLGMMFVAIAMDIVLQDFIAKLWVMLLALPLPLSCLVLGIIGKKRRFKSTKNIVTGIIFSCLLCIYGSFSFIFRGTYSYDYSLVYRVEQTIAFDLPHEGKIFTTLYDNTQSFTGGIYLKTDSSVKFTNAADIEKYIKNMNESSIWTTSVETRNTALLPPLYTYANYDYYMLYCAEANLYNEIPAVLGEYDFIFLGFDAKINVLVIVEYRLQLS